MALTLITFHLSEVIGTISIYKRYDQRSDCTLRHDFLSPCGQAGHRLSLGSYQDLFSRHNISNWYEYSHGPRQTADHGRPADETGVGYSENLAIFTGVNSAATLDIFVPDKLSNILSFSFFEIELYYTQLAVWTGKTMDARFDAKERINVKSLAHVSVPVFC